MQEDRNKRIEYRRLANGSHDIQESHEDEEKEQENISIESENNEVNQKPENAKELIKNEKSESVPEPRRRRFCRMFSIFSKFCCFSKYKEIPDAISTSEKGKSMEVVPNSESISQSEEDVNLNRPIEEDFQTVLLSYTSILERNEMNIRMIKHKLRTIVEVLIPVETLSCILTDMDCNLKKLEKEINEVKQVVEESVESIRLTREKYLKNLQEAEKNLKKIEEVETDESGFKEMIAQQILLGLFQNEEGRKQLALIREHEKEALKVKAKAVGRIGTCNKNLATLESQLKIISKTEAMEKKFLNFKQKILDIYKFQDEVRRSIDSIENSQIIDLEALNSKVMSLIATYKSFQSFYLEVGTIRSELSKKEKIVSINEKIGELSVEIAAEEAAVELLNHQVEELSKELDEKIKELTFSSAQDFLMSGGPQAKPVVVEIKRNQIVDEEKVCLKDTSSEDVVIRQNSHKKSPKTVKAEFDIIRIKQQLQKVKNELSKKRELQEQYDQMLSLKQRLENESFIHMNTINSQLAKTCEKYQILINHMSRPKATFTPETTTALIGVLCSFLTISPKPSFFSCNFLRDKKIKSKMTLPELYELLSKKISEKNIIKTCFFCPSALEIVHNSSVLDMNEIINLLFNNDLIGCIKTDKKSNGIDLVSVEAIYSQLVQLIKKLSEIVVVQRQLQVKINSEQNWRILNDLTRDAISRIRGLGYVKIASQLEVPKGVKKIKFHTYLT